MVERPLSVREAGGSMPPGSIFQPNASEFRFQHDGAARAGVEPGTCALEKEDRPLHYGVLRNPDHPKSILLAAHRLAAKHFIQRLERRRPEKEKEREGERERERERAERPAVRGGRWGSSPEEMKFSRVFPICFQRARPRRDPKNAQNKSQHSRVCHTIPDFALTYRRAFPVVLVF